MSDEDLVMALRDGDTDSLGVLVTRWQAPLHRFVYRMLPKQDDARDICQETFLRVLKKADRFKVGSRFSTWMYQIALNLCRDKLRKQRRWGLLIAESQEWDENWMPSTSGPTEADPASTAERRQLAASVMRALDRLSPPQREVLILKEFEGLKFREIAELLGCPESTVKSRMYGGLSELREALAREGVVDRGRRNASRR